jgi:6-pyruvoyltetrahydropterin/6-carboxytetrahydropterin synthase
MFLLKVSDTFSSGHYLPNYDGKCKNQHGHTWKFAITWQYDRQQTQGPEKGMCSDFHELKSITREIAGILDHKNLNDIISNPTAEHIARWIWEQAGGNVPGGKLFAVHLWESEDCEVIYSERNVNENK